MRYVVIGVLILVALSVRLFRFRRRRAAEADQRSDIGSTSIASSPQQPVQFGPFNSDIGLVAGREVRERFRGRVFRVGTLLMLVAVSLAIVIPTLDHGTTSPTVLGVVGRTSAAVKADIRSAATSTDNTMAFISEPNVADAHRDLRSGRIDLALIDSTTLVVDQAITSTDSSDTAQVAQALAQNLGITKAFEDAGLTTAQSSELEGAKPIPILSLQSASTSKKAPNLGLPLIGLILTFVMLTQYNTWILIGVMEEKASRVVEVLLAAVRPVRLLTGKVLGIGLVAFSQASLIVVVALVVAKAVGSNILHDSAPLVLGSTVLWLVLGYAFYCWVYAAAGSMAERQDQVQSLAFPLSLPVIIGYIYSLTTLESGNVSPVFKVLAYLPPTSPFAMPALVGLRDVTWWQFSVSVGLSLIGTVLMARLAARIYRRAILRTGRKVRLREAMVGSAS
jgi:ABC-2 type transport system permease protein